MPHWYAGGFKQFNDYASAWVDACPDTDLYVSLVTGGTALLNDNRDWQTLDQLLVANPGLSLMADAKNVALTGKTFVWNSSAGYLSLQKSGQVVFTTPGAAQTIAGLLIHDDTDAVPANCTLWGFEESQAPNQVTLGGNVNWGTTGTNVIFRLIPQIIGSTYSCSRGLCTFLNNYASGWDISGYTLGYALVKTGTFSRERDTVQSLKVFGTTFATNCEPGGANSPTVGVTNRLQSAYDAALNEYQYKVDNVVEVLFDSTDGGWEIGANITAIVAYMYPTGAYSDSSAWVIAWDPVTIQLTAGVDIVYGAANKQQNRVQLV